MSTHSRFNILQLIASSHGGGATHVLDLAALLPRDQFAVTVAMPQDGGNVSREAIEATGATFVPVEIRDGLKLGELMKVRRLVQNGRFHLIHVHGARAGLYGRIAALTLPNRPKLIFSIHGFATPYYATPKKQLYLGLERLFQHVTDHTICVAQAERQLFLSYGLTVPEKTSVIHPGIPLERFQPNQHSPDQLRRQLNLADAPVILTVCRLHIPRDFETLLTAVSSVKQTIPTIHLLIVGDGPMRAEIEAKIDALGLTQNVTLLGFRQDIPDLLAAADIYTLTSSGWEGFPISTLEAQAMGCPVVVSDAGGSGEAVLHGQTGLVVPKRDPNALAQAYLSLLQKPDLRNKLGQNGAKRARTRLSRQVMVGGITAVMQTLLAPFP